MTTSETEVVADIGSDYEASTASTTPRTTSSSRSAG